MAGKGESIAGAGMET
uniref:Uncharacterized protein n=1 Tax=Moniliophthora roreri TaxID=221103 RepID=A0A0W0F7A2_MONRR